MGSSPLPSVNPMGTNWVATAAHVSVRGLVVATRDNDRVLLDGIDLAIGPGERLAIVGASGAGKTLLARAIVGVLPESIRIKTGSIEVSPAVSTAANDRNDRESIRATMVPQIASSALPPLSRTLPFISAVVRWSQSVVGEDATKKAVNLLETVGLGKMSEVRYKRPHQLSGGMAARVAVAAALATSPSVLIVDEPTNGLDPPNRKVMCSLLLSINRDHGTSLIVATHDIWLVAQLCPRALVLEQGRVVALRDPWDFAKGEAESYTARLFKPLRLYGEKLSSANGI